MLSRLNWQSQEKLEGSKCYVPVRHLSNARRWGRIGQTQITLQRVCPIRVKFVYSNMKREPVDHLLKLSAHKRSMSGTFLAKIMPEEDGIMPKFKNIESAATHFRLKFYTGMKKYAGWDAGTWGADVIIGDDHKHFSIYDQGDASERDGNYKSLPPIPSPFMVNFIGNFVPWVSDPLSDSRSLGDWDVKYTRFYVNDDVEEGDAKVSDRIVINRVGHYYFH